MKNKNNGVGRPKYAVKWPNRKFTMQDLMVANEVNPKTGKGKLCTKLTLVKALQRDMFMADPTTGKPDLERPRRTSLIVRVKDETREPNSKTGLGRKTYVYIRREKLANVTKVATVKSPKTEAPTVDYETQKSALLSPVPVVSITPEPAPVPVAEVIPTAPEPVTA
jgi:hypothetical protein